MFNKVILVGNLTKNIELRYLSNGGAAVGNTGIAVTRKFTTNGEKREEVCFVDLTFFGRTAEVANQYLSKGSKILVEGRLKFDQWVDNNGQNRSKHSIVVENMEMLGGGANQNNQNTQSDDNGYKSNKNSYSKQNNYNESSNSYQKNDYQKQDKSIKDDYIDDSVDVDSDNDVIPF